MTQAITLSVEVKKPKTLGLRFRLAALLIILAEKVGRTTLTYKIKQD